MRTSRWFQPGLVRTVRSVRRVAAARLGRRFLGNDLNPEAVRITAQRLREFGEGRVPADLPAGPAPDQPDLLESIATRS